MEPQPAPAAPGVLARLSSHLDWYWTLSPRGRAAFWATFGGWALDAYNRMTVGFVLPAVTAAFALRGSWAARDRRLGDERCGRRHGRGAALASGCLRGGGRADKAAATKSGLVEPDGD